MGFEDFFQLVAEDLLEICEDAEEFSVEFVVPVRFVKLEPSAVNLIRIEYEGYMKRITTRRRALRNLFSAQSLGRFLGGGPGLKERVYGHKSIGIPYKFEKRRLPWIYDAEVPYLEETQLGFLTVSPRWLVLVAWKEGRKISGVTVIELVGEDQKIAMKIGEVLFRVLGAVKKV